MLRLTLLCAAQVGALDAVLCAELGVPPGDGWGNGGLLLSEGGIAAPVWASVGSLRQRCDARGDAFCIRYRLKDAAPTDAPL